MILNKAGPGAAAADPGAGNLNPPGRRQPASDAGQSVESGRGPAAGGRGGVWGMESRQLACWGGVQGRLTGGGNLNPGAGCASLAVRRGAGGVPVSRRSIIMTRMNIAVYGWETCFKFVLAVGDPARC